MSTDQPPATSPRIVALDLQRTPQADPPASILVIRRLVHAPLGAAKPTTTRRH
jgi:hypothetical protein